MYQNEIEIIKSRIENKHQGDEKQLEIIFSPNKRLLVEAPAGYGKTHTMVGCTVGCRFQCPLHQAHAFCRVAAGGARESINFTAQRI